MYGRHSMRWGGLFLVAGMLMAIGAQGAWAKAHLYNGYMETVQIYWQASGCAGVKYPCGRKGSLGFVCSHKTAQPGETKDYGFPSGSSDHAVKIAVCSSYGGTGSMQSHSTGNSNNRSRCAVYPSGSSHKSKCGYTSDEYDACKQDSSNC
jgi:hypothetical protein